MQSPPRALLQPMVFNGKQLSSRLVMPAMTRCRASVEGFATPLMEQYYAERAATNFIVSESNMISQAGRGYPRGPGLFSIETARSWQPVTEAVHRRGSTIFAQLWHPGRLSDPSLLGGAATVAPSAIAPEGRVPRRINKDNKEFSVPRELERSEVDEIISDFIKASSFAMMAGFDGVEIHAGFGYLIDQFLHKSSNIRRDRYGGSINNRLSFLLNIIDGVVECVGQYKVGILITPFNTVSGMHDDKENLFGVLIKSLQYYPLSYIHWSEPIGEDARGQAIGKTAAEFCSSLNKHIGIASGLHDIRSAERFALAKMGDLFGFGRLYLANSRLENSVRAGIPLNIPDSRFFYEGEEIGYLSSVDQNHS